MLRILAIVGCLSIAMSVGCSQPHIEDGITRAKGSWKDNGEAKDDASVRALVSVKLPDRAKLDAFVHDLYDPASPSFRQYLTAEEATSRFAPTEADAESVTSWLTSHNLEVFRVAHNRLLLEVRGNVKAFNEAFVTHLHGYTHDDGYEAYGTPAGWTLPRDVAAFGTIASLDTGVREDVQEDTGEITTSSVPAIGLVPSEVTKAYGFDQLAHRGKGVRIGVVTGGGIAYSDVATFWNSVDVGRSEPQIKEIMERPPLLGFEATFDVEWAGVLAPEADVIVFQGPDPRTTSLLFAFNDAASSGDADVVTDSFAHREETEPVPTRELYDIAAELGAAIGTTIVAATGDSAKPDIPATCPFVTGVGGTHLKIEEDGTISERAWERTGAGVASFPAPAWQKLASGGHAQRQIPDVSLNAGTAYASRFKGQWRPTGGTSVASPVFAALVAVINGARHDEGKPNVGFLNPALYGESEVQKSFRDITSGGTSEFVARGGWDMPSGWGAPHAAQLASTLP